MDPHLVQDLYDPEYARAYDHRFLTGEDWSRQGTDFEVELITVLLDRPEARWLDVACGTGHYLGQFPDVERTGLDLAPGMLEAAADAAPTATLVQGSYLDPRPEWEGRWNLVSCMWAAYSYVESLAQVEDLVANLASWTAPDGAAFMPVVDVADLAGGIDVPYRNDDTWVFGGTLLIKSVVWDWHDEALGKHHRNLVAPHLDHLVEVFGRHFGRVEVVRYPPYLPGWDTRKAIVASRRRAPGDDAPTEVVRHDPPPCRTVLPEADAPVEADAAAPTADAPSDVAAPVATEPPADPEPTPAASAPGTGRLLARARPWRRTWWSSVGRRGRSRALVAVRAAERRLTPDA